MMPSRAPAGPLQGHAMSRWQLPAIDLSDARVGFAYAPNHMYAGPGASPRTVALVDALYGCL